MHQIGVGVRQLNHYIVEAAMVEDRHNQTISSFISRLWVGYAVCGFFLFGMLWVIVGGMTLRIVRDPRVAALLQKPDPYIFFSLLLIVVFNVALVFLTIFWIKTWIKMGK